MPKPISFGPLPQTSQNQLQEAASMTAFKAHIPNHLFLIRDVRGSDDYGIDLQLEVICGTNVTNFSAYVQLKSTESLEMNQDGSFSLSVDASNLNYLLNKPLGIYILYLKNLNEFRYEWVQEEYQRIKASTPQWQKQKTVSIVFQRRLTPESINEIYNHIIKKSRDDRNLREIVDAKTVRKSNGLKEQPLLVININDATIIDSTESLTTLQKQGIDLVAKGYAEHVLNLAQHISRDALQEKKIQLALAYAYYFQGHLLAATTHLSDCELAQGVLAPHEYLFSSLQNACDFSLGSITRKEFYQREQSAIEKLSDPQLKTRASLYNVRTAIPLLIKQEIEAKTLDGKLTLLEQQVQSLQDPELLLLAKIARFELTSEVYFRNFTNSAFDLKVKSVFGQVSSFAKIEFMKQSNKSLDTWIEEITFLISIGKSLNDILLLGDILSTAGKILFGLFHFSETASKMLQEKSIIPNHKIEAIVDILEEAKNFFAENKILHQELKTAWALLELYPQLGKMGKAIELARWMRSEARAKKYTTIALKAQEFLDENEHISRETNKSHTDEYKFDRFLAQSNENQLKDLAKSISQASQQPLFLVQKGLEAEQKAAQERESHCRHLYIEGVGSQGDLWQCRCILKGFTSQLADSQIVPVISIFKKSYCEGCTQRISNPNSIEKKPTNSL